MIDLADMISKERRDVYNAMRWSRLWKQVAKEWRHFANIAIEDLESGGQRYYYRKWVNEKALAASRKELLREAKDAIKYGYYSKTLLERIDEELAQDQADEYIESEDAHIVLEVGDEN